MVHEAPGARGGGAPGILGILGILEILAKYGYKCEEVEGSIKFECPRGRQGKHAAKLSCTYNPERTSFWCDLCSGGGYAESLLKWLAEDLPPRLTDLGNAIRLVNTFGDDLRYRKEIGWFVWSGRRWEHDETGHIHRHAKRVSDLIRQEAKELLEVAKKLLEVPEADEDKKKKRVEKAEQKQAIAEALLEWAKKSEGIGRIEAAIALARSDLRVAINDVESLDGDPWRLNVLNGTIDLRTGTLSRPRKDDLITRLGEVRHDEVATCPRWLEFLTEIFKGDNELIGYLQRAVGYTLTGCNTEQVFFFCHGMGRNGKSTFLNVISRLMGDYAKMMPTDSLMQKRTDGIPNDLARLRGARLVRAMETDENRRLAESLIKQITGGEPITARFLHHEFFEFIPQFKIWISGNHKPSIRGADDGIWRRVRLIPFNVTIALEAVDPHLGDKLVQELPGILNWALEGCKRWQTEGLGEVAAVKEATGEYKEESNLVARFLEEQTIRHSSDQYKTVAKQALYGAFREWATRQGEYPCKFRDFNQRMARLGFDPDQRDKHQRLWVGLELIHSIYS